MIIFNYSIIKLTLLNKLRPLIVAIALSGIIIVAMAGISMAHSGAEVQIEAFHEDDETQLSLDVTGTDLNSLEGRVEYTDSSGNRCTETITSSENGSGTSHPSFLSLRNADGLSVVEVEHDSSMEVRVPTGFSDCTTPYVFADADTEVLIGG